MFGEGFRQRPGRTVFVNLSPNGMASWQLGIQIFTLKTSRWTTVNDGERWVIQISVAAVTTRQMKRQEVRSGTLCPTILTQHDLHDLQDGQGSEVQVRHCQGPSRVVNATRRNACCQCETFDSFRPQVLVSRIRCRIKKITVTGPLEKIEYLLHVWITIGDAVQCSDAWMHTEKESTRWQVMVTLQT